MSEQGVEVVRRGMAAFRERDWDTLASYLDPDILIRTDPRWPEQRIYGREAALAFYRGVWESVGSDVRIEEIVDLEDRVLAVQPLRVSGQLSGIEGEQRVSTLCTLRAGRIILIEYFLNHDEALRAVGLVG